MYDLIIIGGGPAGMTAAVYAARKKINTLLLAKEIGGQVMWTSSIENYMGYQLVEGVELISKFEEQMLQFPIDKRAGEEVVSVSYASQMFEVKIISGESFQAKSVIIATGKKPRRLGVPGELELTGRGVSYCSVCDGPFFAGEAVAVIGGGNSALESIDDMLKISPRVYSITEVGFTGDEVLADRVRSNLNLVMYPEWNVIDIIGQDRVESITIQSVKDGQRKSLDVRGVFVEIGLTPNSDLVKNITQLNARQEIEVNCNTETDIPGLYAAGDVASTPEKQIIIAAGDGAKAALQAHRYLQRLA